MGSDARIPTIRSHSIQGRLAALAAKQNGNVRQAQLIDLGLSRSAIARRVKSSYLIRVHPGVYAVGRRPMAALERAHAAVLACGEAALLSHGSALALWDLGSWSGSQEVTVPGDRRPPGIRVHRSTNLTARDVRRRHGIPVTSPARTLLDCAPRLGARGLTRAINDALRAKIVGPADVTELLTRCGGHRGAGRLRAVTEAHPGTPTRSTLEDDFLRFCRRFELPSPLVNTEVCGYEVDVYFEPERLIVELDGWGFHASRDSFERDRRRDAVILAAGIETVRITWKRLHHEADTEATLLRAILNRRRRAAG